MALAAYAGAAIAKGNPMKTGITATRLAIAAFIIPFIFAYSPEILLVGDLVWYDVVLLVITAILGMIGVAAGLSGYLLKKMNVLERLLTVAGGLCLMIPGIKTDLAGIVILTAVVALQLCIRKKVPQGVSE